VVQTQTLAAGLAPQSQDALRHMQEEQAQDAWLRVCEVLVARFPPLQVLPELQ
jgi:hypothetical protein